MCGRPLQLRRSLLGEDVLPGAPVMCIFRRVQSIRAWFAKTLFAGRCHHTTTLKLCKTRAARMRLLCTSVIRMHFANTGNMAGRANMTTNKFLEHFRACEDVDAIVSCLGTRTIFAEPGDAFLEKFFEIAEEKKALVGQDSWDNNVAEKFDELADDIARQLRSREERPTRYFPVNVLRYREGFDSCSIPPSEYARTDYEATRFDGGDRGGAR